LPPALPARGPTRPRDPGAALLRRARVLPPRPPGRRPLLRRRPRLVRRRGLGPLSAGAQGRRRRPPHRLLALGRRHRRPPGPRLPPGRRLLDQARTVAGADQRYFLKPGPGQTVSSSEAAPTRPRR